MQQPGKGSAVQPLKPLDQQAVVLVGASSGIGRVAAQQFAERGAAVVLAARNERALRDVASAIEWAGGRALAVPTDVTDWNQVQRLAERAVERFGRIDTWVNDAGVSVYSEFQQMGLDEFERVIDVTLLGTVYGCRAALPHLEREGRGALICVGSVLSDRGAPLQSAYSAAKAGVKGFTEALRVELAHRGSEVQVTLVKPASMDTPFFDHALTRMGVRPKPIAPVYAPEVAAAAIVHAAEHRARDIVAGGSALTLTGLEAFAGGLLDRVMVARAYESQQTDEPKASDAPNTLLQTAYGPGRERGGFGGRSLSLLGLLRGRRRLALGVAAAAGVATLARRLPSGERQRPAA